MSNEQHSKKCALAGVDRRLDDVHQQWHQAEEAYFDPERFRLAIQAAIQTLRTVTFVLQNHKQYVPDFEGWYADWQERLKADLLMRWMVDARNKIEKQGDLEVRSFVRAEIIASYLDEGPRIEVPARLFDDLPKLLKSISDSALGEHIRNHGTLKIERRWVENTLPNHELLDAVAIAYGRISELVSDAHRQMGLQPPVTTNMKTSQQYDGGARDGRLPCMIGHADSRSLNVSLADGRPVQFEQVCKVVDRTDAEKAAARYGGAHKGMFGPDNASEEAIVASLFHTARKVFQIDGYHRTIFFLLRERKPVHMFEIRPQDQSQKYLLLRTVAHEVVKYGADAVVALAEAWLAPANSLKPYQLAEDSPVRREALTATLVVKHGHPIRFTAIIHRDEASPKLEETRIDRDPILFSFAPVYEAWGRPIPDQWMSVVKEFQR